MNEHVDPGGLRDLETLPEARRRELLAHAAGCAECHRRLAGENPANLFALLAVQPLPAGALERLSQRVDGEVSRRAATKRASGSWRAVASIAASLLLAVLFGTYVSQRDMGPIPARAAALELEALAPPRGIELMSSPGQAEVVDIEVGGTRVVMIFDKELNI